MEIERFIPLLMDPDTKTRQEAIYTVAKQAHISDLRAILAYIVQTPNQILEDSFTRVIHFLQPSLAIRLFNEAISMYSNDIKTLRRVAEIFLRAKNERLSNSMVESLFLSRDITLKNILSAVFEENITLVLYSILNFFISRTPSATQIQEAVTLLSNASLIEKIKTFIHQEDPILKIFSLRFLRTFPFIELKDEVAALLTHSNITIAVEALKTLRSYPPKLTAPLIIKLAVFSNKEIQQVVLEFIEENMPNPQIEEEIKKLIESSTDQNLETLIPIIKVTSSPIIFKEFIKRVVNSKLEIEHLIKILNTIKNTLLAIEKYELEEMKEVVALFEPLIIHPNKEVQTIAFAILKLWEAEGIFKILETVYKHKEYSYETKLEIAKSVLFSVTQTEYKQLINRVLSQPSEDFISFFLEASEDLVKTSTYVSEILVNILPQVKGEVAKKLTHLLTQTEADKENIKTTYWQEARSPNPDARIKAAEVLSVFINDEDVLSLFSKLIKDPEPAVRKRVIELLGTVQRQEAASLILQSLNDANREVVLASIRALANFPNPNVFTSLSKFLTSTDSNLSMEAAKSLVKIIIKAAKLASNWFPFEVKNEVLNKVMEIYNEEDIPKYLSILQSLPKPFNRQIFNLITTGKENLQHLFSQVFSSSQETAVQCIQTIFYWSPPVVRENTIKLLLSVKNYRDKYLSYFSNKKHFIYSLVPGITNPHIMEDFIALLLDFQDSMASQVIKAKLSSQFENDIIWALEVLRLYPHPEFLSKLEELANHPKEEVRLEVAKTAKIFGDKGKPILEKLASDSSDLVRLEVKKK